MLGSQVLLEVGSKFLLGDGTSLWNGKETKVD